MLTSTNKGTRCVPWGLPYPNQAETFQYGRVLLFCRHNKVLGGNPSTYASDVYSFGVLVWEVITTKLPWAKSPGAKEIMCAVISGARPVFPADAPACITGVAKQCWAEEPEDRLSFKRIMEGLRSNGLGE